MFFSFNLAWLWFPLSLSLSPSCTLPHSFILFCCSVILCLYHFGYTFYFIHFLYAARVCASYNIFEKWFFNLFHRAHSFVSIHIIQTPKKTQHTPKFEEKNERSGEKNWDRWEKEMKELFNTTFEKCADWVCNMIMLPARVPSMESRAFGCLYMCTNVIHCINTCIFLYLFNDHQTWRNTATATIVRQSKG